MSVLHFDMCRKLKKAFADFERDAAESLERARRTNEQLAYAKAWGERHNPEPPSAA